MLQHLINDTFDFPSYHWGLVATLCVLPAVGIAYISRLSLTKRLCITGGFIVLAATATFFSHQAFVVRERQAALINALRWVAVERYKLVILEQTDFLPPDPGSDHPDQLIAVTTPEQIKEREAELARVRGVLAERIEYANQLRRALRSGS